MAEFFGVSAPYEAAMDIVGRFDAKPLPGQPDAKPLEGPMRSPHAEHLARSIFDLKVLDPRTRVHEPIVPIAPISLVPDYSQAGQLRIETSVPQEPLFDTFRSNEIAVDEEVVNTEVIGRFAPIDIRTIAPLDIERMN